MRGDARRHAHRLLVFRIRAGDSQQAHQRRQGDGAKYAGRDDEGGVRKGAPPVFSARPMAMGAVTDFGASEASSSGDPPRNLPISTALAMAVTEPTSSDARIGRALAFTLSRLR